MYRSSESMVLLFKESFLFIDLLRRIIKRAKNCKQISDKKKRYLYPKELDYGRTDALYRQGVSKWNHQKGKKKQYKF